MKLEFESIIDRPVEEVFEFCASRAGFLSHFPYRTNWISGPEYWHSCGERLRFVFYMFGLPFTYEAEITEFEPNSHFVDEMRKGPYKYFRHEHHFEDLGGKTRYRDVLEFSGGFLGLADPFICSPITKSTFAKRHALMKRELSPSNP
ncbi:SRPBCC family protein [Microbulbifer sp. ALW1]|uniref:SRPBCC family protein n=1 Tax=Microbulbifer sp. (strain ALW1) TaxID=1516059 RepID=UPI00135BC611|nr:SRPBCC family protein [Microbulbifer sp. ALW1]